MLVCKTRLALGSILSKFYSADQSIGFVPTMGALHEGHLSLVESAKNECDVVVCSIFVNPTQFNDPKDLEKYPRPIEHDIELLEKANCDVLFLPEVEEIYTGKEQWAIDLDGLDEFLEGEIRPGHYQGVTQVVKILFDIVAPTKAFFGQKDYQQLLVISKMVSKLGLNVKLEMCPTVREKDGLAMSSRNIRLSELERKNALALYRALQLVQSEFSIKSIQQITADATHYLKVSPGIDLEYFQICDGLTLEPVSSNKGSTLVALVAARLGHTRLIDNVILKS
mgnify:FL=1